MFLRFCDKANPKMWFARYWKSMLIWSSWVQEAKAVNFIKLGQSVRFPVVFCPMLLVKDDICQKKIKRIMVAIDSSEAAKQCLRLALFLLRDTKKELILRIVNKDLSGKSSEAPPQKKTPFSHPRSQRQNSVQPVIISSGRPSEQICAWQREMNVDR